MEKIHRQHGTVIFNPEDMPLNGVVYHFTNWNISAILWKNVTKAMEDHPEAPMCLSDFSCTVIV
jgi:hypothetical protein